MFARGGNGFLLMAAISWCAGAIIMYLVRWVRHPNDEWKKLKPGTRDTILEWLVVGILVLIYAIWKGKQ